MEEVLNYEYYSEVQQRDISWLWYPYIPYGKITLLQGDPGEGKSSFVINLTAILTKGGTLPDGTEVHTAKTVVYQCAEDSVEDTIKPRLVKAGADCAKVAFIREDEKGLTLNDDRLESVIKATDAKLLVLDPIQAFIPPDSDMHSATQMRTVMRSLADIAERNHCAILLVGHMNKCSTGKNLYRGLGSIDIAAIARSVLMIERDEVNSDLRYMFPVKSNLAPEGEKVAFILNMDVGFCWVGKIGQDCNKTAIGEDQIEGKLEKAVRVLRMILANHIVQSSEVITNLKQMGISERTVRMAKKELPIKAIKRNNTWWWKLEGSDRDDGPM